MSFDIWSVDDHPKSVSPSSHQKMHCSKKLIYPQKGTRLKGTIHFNIKYILQIQY